ncbi:hypothetical protein OAA60_01825 [Porticoccaceae bacterium]|jgi:hypothetical protein|nr:hypothetical protein [Porticoccaceae bacterium]
MWWNKCFGNRRIKWLKTHVVKKIVKQAPLKNETIKTWNLICDVIRTINFHTISEEECEDLTYCLLNIHSPKSCQYHAEVIFEIIESMSLDVPIYAWKLVKYIVKDCFYLETFSELTAKRCYNSFKHLETIIDTCDIYDVKIVTIAEITVNIRGKYMNKKFDEIIS